MRKPGKFKIRVNMKEAGPFPDLNKLNMAGEYTLDIAYTKIEEVQNQYIHVYFTVERITENAE